MQKLKYISKPRLDLNLIIVSLLCFTLISCETNNSDNTAAAGALALVTNNSSTSSSSTTPSCTTTGTCKIFIANPTAPINAGISGFDTYCNNSTNKPSGSYTYKALVSDGIKRRACSTANCTTGGTSEHIDWVLKPNQQYKRKDGTTTIGTTNANGIFVTSLTNSVEPNLVTGSDVVLTGINDNWTPGDDCNDWTGTGNTMIGAHLEVDYRWYAESSRVCSTMVDNTFQGKAICVEQ